SQMAVLPAWIVNFIKILIGRLRSTNDRLAAALRRLEELEPRRDPGADPGEEISAAGRGRSAGYPLRARPCVRVVVAAARIRVPLFLPSPELSTFQPRKTALRADPQGSGRTGREERLHGEEERESGR